MVDALADGMTGLVWEFQNSPLKEQKGGGGREGQRGLRVQELGFTFSCFIPKDGVKLANGCDSSFSHD